MFGPKFDAACCNGGYWRDKHSKFIKYTRVGEFKFKFKEDEINKS